MLGACPALMGVDTAIPPCSKFSPNGDILGIAMVLWIFGLKAVVHQHVVCPECIPIAGFEFSQSLLVTLGEPDGCKLIQIKVRNVAVRPDHSAANNPSDEGTGRASLVMNEQGFHNTIQFAFFPRW